uniref:Uncharacterized protein n=1 Tax=Rhynchobrunnera orthospora TaxID=210010 RepID=V5W6A1_9HELO|nr:hypothetical protein [Rhynchobrunnera orthospora]AHC02395.1 hypothetical protein [Rhynchobrunnera orthospora]
MRAQIFLIVRKTSASFTLAKFCGAILTVTILASIKYLISGSFHIEYCDFFNNIGIGLLGWTLNTGIIGWLSEYLGIKGINFNLSHILFGMDTMDLGDKSSPPVEEFKPKLYNAMDVDSEPDSEPKPDKGKGVDKELHPNHPSHRGVNSNFWVSDAGSIPLPVRIPTFVPLPQKIIDEPGFNVPGGVVPIQDEICKHIGYNSHVLKQFRTMGLEKAIEQRDNWFNYGRIMEQRIAYAQSVYQKIPTIPTTEYEFNLKNQIEKDVEKFSREKIEAESRGTLLKSRVEFIEAQRNFNNNNKN